MKRVLFINNRMAFCRPDGHFYISKKPGELVSGLIESGYHLVFMQSFIRVSENQERFSDYKLPFIPQIEYVMIERKYPRIIVYILLYIKGLLKLSKIDFIYIFYPDRLAYLGLLGKLLFRKKCGYYIRGTIGIYGLKSRLLYRFSDLCCTVSPQITNFINNRRKSKVAQTISPMIDFHLSDEVINFQRNYAGSKLKILFVGRITIDKGVRELLNAFVEFHKVFENSELIFIGDGPLLDNLKKYAISENLLDNVHFLGHITSVIQLADLYKTSDLFCLPSYHEGFPRVLYEAMLFKLPIITTFVGTISALMEDMVNCIRIETQDSKSISDALTLLLQDSILRQNIANNAFKTVTSYLSNNKLSHLEIINNFLDNEK